MLHLADDAFGTRWTAIPSARISREADNDGGAVRVDGISKLCYFAVGVPDVLSRPLREITEACGAALARSHPPPAPQFRVEVAGGGAVESVQRFFDANLGRGAALLSEVRLLPLPPFLRW